jgi:EmrB/QacA subfamily drug resistance transporter
MTEAPLVQTKRPLPDREPALSTGYEAEERFRLAPLIVLLAGTFMTFLDFFIVNVAIPELQSNLHASASDIQFVVAVYGLTLSIGLITGGRLGDIVGRRRIFVIGMGLFVVASALCGVSASTGDLIASRGLQGFAAALLTPQVLATLGVVYSGAHRMKAFGAYGLVMGMAGMFGQLVGGALIRADLGGLGWRVIFFINVPIGIAALAYSHRLPESRGKSTRLDLPGVALLSAGLAALIVPLIEGRQQGWPVWTWLSFVGSAVLLAAFAAHQARLERRGGTPLIRLDLFTDRTFAIGVGIALTFCLGLASFWLVLALYLQDGRGLSPLQSGALFIAAGVGFTAAMMAVPVLTPRWGKNVLTVGALLSAAGYLIAAATAQEAGIGHAAVWMIPALLVAGFGIGLVLVPLSETVLARVKPEHAASGSGLLATALELGGALGVAIMGVVYFNALGHVRFDHAFTVSMIAMAGCAIVAAALAKALPEIAPGSK